ILLLPRNCSDLAIFNRSLILATAMRSYARCGRSHSESRTSRVSRPPPPRLSCLSCSRFSLRRNSSCASLRSYFDEALLPAGVSEAVRARFCRFDHPTNLKHISRLLGACEVIHARLINIRSVFFHPTSKTRIILISMVYFLFAQSPAFAQNTPEELRKIARNPFADDIKLTFESDVTFSQGLFDRTANSLQIQPVFPLSITRDWLFITRVVATALAYQPNTAAKRGGNAGVGDPTRACS